MGGAAAVIGAVGGAIGAISGVVSGLKSLFSDNSGGEKVSRMPAYNEQEASMEQTRMVDQILSQERARRKDDISDFDMRSKKAKSTLLKQLRQDIEQFKCFGLNMNYRIFADQFNLLDNNETLAELANRRLVLADSECAQILSIKDGKQRASEFAKYEQKILLEGTDKYFEGLSQSFAVAFHFIEDNVKQQSERLQQENCGRMQDIKNFAGDKSERENSKSKIQKKLENLKKLERLCGGAS